MDVYQGKTFDTVLSAGDDCLHLDCVEAQVTSCTFTRWGCSPDQADELLGIVNGAHATIEHSRFERNGKAILVGTGDTNENDAQVGQGAYIEYSLFDECSRRSVMVNAGNVTLYKCVIRSWGTDACFHTKSYGGRSKGKFAKLTYVDCVFEQESLWRCLTRKNFWKDFINSLSWPWFGFGFMRGAYAEDGGTVITQNCYKNRWWIYLAGRKGSMSKAQADAVKADVYRGLP